MVQHVSALFLVIRVADTGSAAIIQITFRCYSSSLFLVIPVPRYWDSVCP
ncbi:MAG: hypothetical protein ACR5LA_08105 [Wolbachia sp.]